jgi:hypothetical protein
MITRQQWRRFIDHPVVEWTIFAVGVILILLSPLAGVIPGPGGIFVFALGLAMVLKTSMWAKRHYVRFKRKQPKIGSWADWGLRRPSALRRARLAKEQEATEATAEGVANPTSVDKAESAPSGAAETTTPPQVAGVPKAESLAQEAEASAKEQLQNLHGEWPRQN